MLKIFHYQTGWLCLLDIRAADAELPVRRSVRDARHPVRRNAHRHENTELMMP